jgi:hypothetical protein
MVEDDSLKYCIKLQWSWKVINYYYVLKGLIFNVIAAEQRLIAGVIETKAFM